MTQKATNPMITHKYIILTLYRRTGQISTTRTGIFKAYSTNNLLILSPAPEHPKSKETFWDIHGRKKDYFLPAVVQKTVFLFFIIAVT